MLESESFGASLSYSADSQIDIAPMFARLVRVLDAWVTSDSWLDYIR